MIFDANINMINDKSRLCNLNCFFCENKPQNKIISYMNYKSFDQLLKDLSSNLYFKNIDLTPKNSELFMHPEILDIIKIMIKYSNFNFYITTSLAISTKKFDKILELIVNSKNIKIQISNYNIESDVEFKKLTRSSDRLKNKIKINLKKCKDNSNFKLNILSKYEDYFTQNNKPEFIFKNTCKYMFTLYIDYDLKLYKCSCFNHYYDYNDLLISNIQSFMQNYNNILRSKKTIFYNSCNNCYFYKPITTIQKLEFLKSKTKLRHTYDNN